MFLADSPFQTEVVTSSSTLQMVNTTLWLRWKIKKSRGYAFKYPLHLKQTFVRISNLNGTHLTCQLVRGRFPRRTSTNAPPQTRSDLRKHKKLPTKRDMRNRSPC